MNRDANLLIEFLIIRRGYELRIYYHICIIAFSKKIPEIKDKNFFYDFSGELLDYFETNSIIQFKVMQILKSVYNFKNYKITLVFVELRIEEIDHFIILN